MQAKFLCSATALSLALVLLLSALPRSSAAASASNAGGAPAAESAPAAEVNASDPYQLVKTAADALLQALDQHRAEYRQDPSKLRGLVDQVLLPHFDTELAARQVLARHWNSATPEQRQRFIDAFIKSMLDNYGDALLDFTANRMKVLPYRGNPSSAYATVATQVRKDDGSTVAVNYALYHTDQGWKVWDVVIEGVSYVTSFRQDFGEQIDRQGLDAVIVRLEHGEKPAAIGRTTGHGGS